MSDNGNFRSRSSNGASAAAERADPLTELARLIGQDDPFGKLGREFGRAPGRDTVQRHVEAPATAPDLMARPDIPDDLRRSLDDVGSSLAAFRSGRSNYEDDGRQRESRTVDDHPDMYAPEGYAATDGYREGEAPEPQSADADSYYSEDGQLGDGEDFDEEPKKRRRGGLLVVGAVLSLAIIGGTGAFAYRSFSTPARVTDPPVIKADGTPAKVPAAPQSGEKQIYDRVGERSQGERVVSREEQPVDLREPSRGPANMVVTTGSTGTTAPSAAISPPAAPSGTEPKKVKTLVIRPDQTSAPTPAPIRTAPVRTTGSAPSRTASLPAAGDAGYLVQLASQKTEADAQASYRALQGRFPTQLGSRPAVIRRVDLGEKGTFFRALVGPFGSADQATDFCGSLKTAGGQCLVQRN